MRMWICNPEPAFPAVIFRSESDVVSILGKQGCDNPFGNHQLVGCLLGTYRQKFDFVLLVYLAVKGEVTHFGMPVL